MGEKIKLHIQSPIFFFFNVYLFLREKESASNEDAEREGLRIRSWLCTDSREPSRGLELTDCETMTRAEVRCSSD